MVVIYASFDPLSFITTSTNFQHHLEGAQYRRGSRVEDKGPPSMFLEGWPPGLVSALGWENSLRTDEEGIEHNSI